MQYSREFISEHLSEARFFAEFIGLSEPAVESLLPAGDAPPVQSYTERVITLARPGSRL